MRRFNPIILMLVVIALLVGMSGTVLARELAKGEIKVRMEIPVRQQLTVLQSTEINFTYPEHGQAVEFQNIGMVRVQSNANWALTVGAVADGNVDVAVRPSGDIFARWQNVQGQGGVYTGPHGTQEISWDVRVENWAGTPATQQGVVQLYFTLGQS